MPGNISTEYRRWWTSFSQKERNTLIASGTFKADALDNPERALHDSRVDQDKFDFAEPVTDDATNNDGTRRVRSTDFTTPPAIDQVIANEADAVPPDPRLADIDLATFRLRGMLHFLLESLDKSTDPEMPLTAQIIRIVVGEGCPPKMSELAKRYGMTRAAVSLRCCSFSVASALNPPGLCAPNPRLRRCELPVSYPSIGSNSTNIPSELRPAIVAAIPTVLGVFHRKTGKIRRFCRFLPIPIPPARSLLGMGVPASRGRDRCWPI